MGTHGTAASLIWIRNRPGWYEAKEQFVDVRLVHGVWEVIAVPRGGGAPRCVVGTAITLKGAKRIAERYIR